MYLYHGSTVFGLTKLVPKRRSTPTDYEGGQVIFAANNPAYAACHSFLWETSEGFILRQEGDNIVFTVPKQFAKRLNEKVAIYKVDGETFKLLDEGDKTAIYTSEKEVDVLDITEFQSVRDALTYYGVILIIN